MWWCLDKLKVSTGTAVLPRLKKLQRKNYFKSDCPLSARCVIWPNSLNWKALLSLGWLKYSHNVRASSSSLTEPLERFVCSISPPKIPIHKYNFHERNSYFITQILDFKGSEMMWRQQIVMAGQTHTQSDTFIRTLTFTVTDFNSLKITITLILSEFWSWITQIHIQRCLKTTDASKHFIHFNSMELIHSGTVEVWEYDG